METAELTGVGKSRENQAGVWADAWWTIAWWQAVAWWNWFGSLNPTSFV